MRMSASIFDNVRQPGIYENLEQSTNGDENNMRRSVLARLRLDDLLTNISLGTESRIVWSISDTIDGRLFTLFPPHELNGIDFEIFCRPDIAKTELDKIVPKVLRSWIQDESGNGRPGGFLALGESIHRHVAQALSEKRKLNIQSLRDARDVVKNIGIPQPERDRLVELWERWDWAIRERKVTLSPWRGNAASAEPLLRTFLRKFESSRRIPEFSLTEFGTEIFRRALDLLKRNNGRRDAPFKFLLDQIEVHEDSEQEEIREVHRLFQYYTFFAIAKSNVASPEFTAKLFENDIALSNDELDRIESNDERRHPINMHASIVSGLGGIDASDYTVVKAEVRSKIRDGIEEFEKSKGVDSSKLHAALDFLAQEIGEKSVDSEGGIFRSMTLPIAGAALGAATSTTLDLIVNPDGGDQWRQVWIGMVGAGIGTSTGLAVDEVGKQLGKKYDYGLLRKSLVKSIETELRERLTS